MSDPQSAVDSFNQYLCDYYVPGTALITGSETVTADYFCQHGAYSQVKDADIRQIITQINVNL